MMKVCITCGDEHPEEYYRVLKPDTGYRIGHCKPCVNAKAKAYRDAHPEVRAKERARSMAYRQIPENAQKGRDAAKKWAQDNPELKKAKLKAWHADNKGRMYGLRPGEFDEMVKAQGGLCAICGEPPSGKRDILMIDHCHDENRVRQLLCHRCNSGLGLFRDNSELLEAAARYIQKQA
jgi:Recombination endonuclease VII